MPDIDLELAGVDGLNETDLTEEQMDTYESLEDPKGEPELELVDPGAEEATNYLGKFKSVRELETYARKLELEREAAQQAPTIDPRAYGIDLSTIPDEQRVQLDAAARAYLGQSLEQTMQEVATGRALRVELEGMKREKLVQAQQTELRAEWGADYDEIMSSVRAEFATLTNEEKRAYDTVNGALALGAKYQLAKLRGQAAATPQVTKVPTPTMLKASQPSQQFAKQTEYTWEQIEAQSLKDPTWYPKNAARISQLSKLGRIK